MANITVKHQSIELNWKTPAEVENPKTLVLGSFNPFNGLDNSLDYYYGRSENYFWRIIAEIIGENDMYFFDPAEKAEKLNRKLEIMRNRFCCLDVINSIKFYAESHEILNEFVHKKVYSGFLDQTIWTTNMNFNKKGKIKLSRSYNSSIIEVLKHSPTIKKVIHTMGNNRIGANYYKPKEKKLEATGFGFFMETVVAICNKRKIDFVTASLSPSGYAVNNKRTSKEELKVFLTEHLGLNQN